MYFLLSRQAPTQELLPSPWLILSAGHLQVTLVPRGLNRKILRSERSNVSPPYTGPSSVLARTPELSSLLSQPVGWLTSNIIISHNITGVVVRAVVLGLTRSFGLEKGKGFSSVFGNILCDFKKDPFPKIIFFWLFDVMTLFINFTSIFD